MSDSNPNLTEYAEEEGVIDEVEIVSDDTIFTSDIENQVLNTDSLEVLKNLGNNCVDLILTDPPYGIDVGDKNGQIGGVRKGVDAEVNKYDDLADGVSWDKGRIDKEFFDEMRRVSKNQIIFGGNYYTDYLYPSSFIVWDKKMSGNFADAELAWMSFDVPVKKYEWRWCGMIRKGDEKKYHPTQKPVGLFKKILNDFSDEDDLVLDPFLGAGTTAVASKKMGRDYIGIELQEKYTEIAKERLDKVQAGKDGLDAFITEDEEDEEQEEEIDEDVTGYAVEFKKAVMYNNDFFDEGQKVVILPSELENLEDVVEVKKEYKD